MVSLEQIKESLARLEENDSRLLAAVDALEVALKSSIDVLAGQYDEVIGRIEAIAAKPKRKGRKA